MSSWWLLLFCEGFCTSKIPRQNLGLLITVYLLVGYIQNPTQPLTQNTVIYVPWNWWVHDWVVGTYVWKILPATSGNTYMHIPPVVLFLPRMGPDGSPHDYFPLQ